MTWLNTIGLVLVAAGIVLGIVQPTIHARRVRNETNRGEWWLGLRYYASVGLVVVGTLLQLYASWPSGHPPT